MSEMQALLQQAREMLASQGAPVTTENLNRAMLALSQNQSAPADGFSMEAQVDRVMQRSTGRPAARANVPTNRQPSTPVGGASQMPPDENAQDNNADLPMPPPDIRDAAQEAGQRQMIIPGEGIMYSPANAPTSSLDGNGMSNRFLRDLVMGAESAGAVSGMLPPVGGAAASGGGALPNIRLGMNRPQLPGPTGSVASVGDDAAGAAVSATPRPALPGSGGAQAQLPAPQQALPAPPSVQMAPHSTANMPPASQAVRNNTTLDEYVAQLPPMQRATLMGPTPAGNAAFEAARTAARSGGPRGQSSRAAQQRASNRSNASN